MHVRIIERAPLPEWASTIDEVRRTVAANHEVSDDDALRESGVNLWIGTDMTRLREDLRNASAEAQRRTIVMGIAPGFELGALTPQSGSLVEVLEEYKLAGAFAPQALTTWQEVPSWFAGPRALMQTAGTNAFKAMQSWSYAIWFAARGATLAEFLASYLPLVEQHASVA